MKKAVISIAVLVILIGISIAAFIAVKSDSDKKAAESESSLADNVLFSFESDDINRLDITNPDGSYTFELQGEKWLLTDCSDEPFEVNQVKLQGICTFISSLTASDNYGSADDSSKSQYGLDSPYIVTAYEGGNTHTLYIGNQSPTKQYYYASTDRNNNVYAIAAADADSILSERLSLKDNKLIPYETTEITEMKLVRDGREIYDLTYDSDDKIWRLPEKYNLLTIDQTKITTITALITRLTAEEMLAESDEDMELYGFDKPIAEFTVKAADGTEKKLIFSKYGTNPDTYTYVYNCDEKQAEIYYAADMDFIDKTPIDFILKSVECADIYSVSEIDIESDSLNEHISLNMTDKWAEIRGKKIDLSNAELENYFKNFFNSFSYISIESIDVDVSPKLDKPLFKAVYTDNEGGKTEIAVTATDNEDLCYVFKDGEYTGTLTPNDFIFGSSSASSAFELLCRQAGIE